MKDKKERKMVEVLTALLEEGADLENHLALELSTGGPVIIRLMPDKAPNHVKRFKELARKGFYDGIVFHRVIEGFMAQTGDPTGTGSGGSGVNIEAEFNDVPHARGIVSTARSGHPDSADSQFFIMLAEAPHLDNQYTVWGTVISGMEYIDAIERGSQENGGVVPIELRDKMESVRVAADIDLQ
ncbi:MAG: peptidylprolyl isomerase [Sphingomonadales bacterium]